MLRSRLVLVLLPVVALFFAGCAASSGAQCSSSGIECSCHARPTYVGSAGRPCGDGPIGQGYPAGAACSVRCDQCHPSHGEGSNCVCDGARWICPGDTPCSGGDSTQITYYGGTLPETCTAPPAGDGGGPDAPSPGGDAGTMSPDGATHGPDVTPPPPDAAPPGTDASNCFARPSYLGLGGPRCADGPTGSGYPAGMACSTRCEQCAPTFGEGSNCVCDGQHWVCPGDFGCTSGTIPFQGGVLPATCP